MNFEKNDNDQTIYSQAPGKYLVDDSSDENCISLGTRIIYIYD